MILIGDENIPYEHIEKINSISEIKKTKPNSLVMFDYNQTLVDYCFKNSLSYMVVIKDLKEGIYANALEAKYIVCEKIMAKDIQQIADNYMFDSKILAIISSNDEFKEIAKDQIDGIIYKNLLNEDEDIIFI